MLMLMLIVMVLVGEIIVRNLSVMIYGGC